MVKKLTQKPTSILKKKKSSGTLAAPSSEVAELVQDKPNEPKPKGMKAVVAEKAISPPTKKSSSKRKSTEEDSVLPTETSGPAKAVKKARKESASQPEEAEKSEKQKRVRGKVVKEANIAKEVEVPEEETHVELQKAQVQEPASEKKKSSKKHKPKPKSPSPPPVESDDEEEKEEMSGAEGKDVHMFGFSTDDNDSSDDEGDMGDESDGVDTRNLPNIAKDDETVKRRLEKAKRKPATDVGVVFLGRIPHGFYEKQMREYFTQFGNVTRLRLSRNKKTGRPKHYAFIEFDSASVAQIVAETMDNYLLLGHILTCKVIPKDEVHPELWIGANRKWRQVPRDRVARVQHNKPRTGEEQAKAERRLLKRQAQKKRKIEEAGIKYSFDAVAYKKKPKA